MDIPEYKAWASFKAGSSVMFTYPKDGKVSSSEQKTTLKSVADDQIILDVVMSSDGKMGPSAERKVLPKLPADQAWKKVKEGDEEIEAGERKLKCHWGEFEKKMASGKTVISEI